MGGFAWQSEAIANLMVSFRAVFFLVPELTCNVDIQLNKRLSLRRHPKLPS
jgi:hypothetical protein